MAELTAGSRGTMRAFLGVPFRRQTYQNLAYLLLAFPLGMAYFVGITIGVALGIGLAILLVGVVILVVTIGIALVLVGFERVLTNLLLETEIQTRGLIADGSPIEQLRPIALNPQTWTGLFYLPAKFVFGLVSLIWIMVAFPTGFAMLAVPFYYDRPGLYVGLMTDRAPEIHQTIYLGWNYMLVGFDAVVTLGYWEINSLPAALIIAIAGVVLLLLALHACNVMAWAWGRFAAVMIDGSFDPITAAIQTGERRSA